ncbi:MAG: hypothetical protein QXX79_01090 [Candidatus Bathyarchaeia archaeon]
MIGFENISYTVVKGLLPYITLATIKKTGENTLNNILKYIEKEFNTHIPSSTMYGIIYSLERKGYIQMAKGRRYGLSRKGSILLKKAEGTIKEFFPKINVLLEI